MYIEPLGAHLLFVLVFLYSVKMSLLSSERGNQADDSNDDDELLCKSLAKEARLAVPSIAFGVEWAGVSDKLESSDLLAYINVRTLERTTWCVELTQAGYVVISDTFDDTFNGKRGTQRYETIEALMLAISPMFGKRLNELVVARLQESSSVDATSSDVAENSDAD